MVKLMVKSYLIMVRKIPDYYLTTHRVDITEGASVQFRTWFFNVGPYGQLRAVRGKNSIMNYIIKVQWADLTCDVTSFRLR